MPAFTFANTFESRVRVGVSWASPRSTERFRAKIDLKTIRLLAIWADEGMAEDFEADGAHGR